MTKKRKPKKLTYILLVTLVVFSLATVICLGSVSILKTLYPRRYIEFVEIYSRSNNLSEEFVFAVIECESGFDKDAVSYLGAEGLMQVMPETFAWLQEKRGEELPAESIFEPVTAIDYGCYFYGMLMEQLGDEATAVAAYHAGAAQVTKGLSDKKYSDDGKTLKDIPYPSTKKYVEKVMRVKNIYNRLYYK